MLRFSAFLRRQEGYKHEDIQSQLNKGLEDGKYDKKYYDKPLGEPGKLNRTLSFKNKAAVETFLKPYTENVGKEYREPTLLATSAYEGEALDLGGQGQKVVFNITAKSDGTGQGKNMEKYRGIGRFEGEVVFPPYSKFKIDRVEEVKKGRSAYTRVYLTES
jgi:hypothetical protein